MTMLSHPTREELLEVADNDPNVVALSALSGEGCDVLTERLGALLTEGAQTVPFDLSPADGRRIAWLHAHAEIIDEDDMPSDDGEPLRRIVARISPADLSRFRRL